jgi:hypothetical protein
MKLEWINERRKLGDLKFSEGNPRHLKKYGGSTLGKSLEKFNLVEVPVIDTDNTIIAGHQRVGSLLQTHGRDHEIDVRMPNRKLTDEEFREYRIRANTHAGMWDFDALANEFDVSELVEFGLGTDELGIDIREPTTPDPKEGVVKLTFEVDAFIAEMVNQKLEEIMLKSACSKGQAFTELVSR